MEKQTAWTYFQQSKNQQDKDSFQNSGTIFSKTTWILWFTFFEKLENVNCFIFKVCIYPIFPLWTECDIRSIFKQSKAGLKSEFSFS